MAETTPKTSRPEEIASSRSHTPNDEITAETQRAILDLNRDIEPLEGQIPPLKGKADWWSAGYIRVGGISLALFILGGSATFFFQWHSERARTALDAATQRLANLKERRVLLLHDVLTHDNAQLHKDNLLLQAQIAPRRLSARQKKAFANLMPFKGLTVEIKSFSSDSESVILATEIMDALLSAQLGVVDNRLTILPAGSIAFGVSVSGSNQSLVDELKKILGTDGNLMSTSSIVLPNRGISATLGAFPTRGAAAIVTVGVKPIKTESGSE